MENNLDTTPDLGDLQTIWNKGDKIRITKLESPIGKILKKSRKEKRVKKKTRDVIVIAKPINVGEPILKHGIKKSGKTRREGLFFATLSSVRRIQKNENGFYIYTDNSKYRVEILK